MKASIVLIHPAQLFFADISGHCRIPEVVVSHLRADGKVASSLDDVTNSVNLYIC